MPLRSPDMTNVVYSLLFVLGVATHLVAQTRASDPDFIQQQLRLALTSIKAGELRSPAQRLIAPRSVRHDTLFMVPSRDWTSGFFAGNLWLTWELTSNPEWKAKAIEFTKLLEAEKYNGKTHDMGFKMYCSYGNGFRLTNDPSYREILLQSARTLCTRFNPTVGCIRSWDHSRDKWGYPVIIDNMMNLELLFWAFRNTGDSLFYQVATRHADTTLKNHFRKDYSSYHVVDYDTITGAVRVRQTHQGYSHESSWARGQAWALYGYTMCYRETHDRRYLDHAMNVASYILTHPSLPSDGIPYWDYHDPKIPDAPRDASAAAVKASALAELGTFDTKRSSYYKKQAKRIVDSLARNYAAKSGADFGFLLRHSTGHLPGRHEIDVPIVYADYYFLEALNSLKR